VETVLALRDHAVGANILDVRRVAKDAKHDVAANPA
jgi:hypothetical protein